MPNPSLSTILWTDLTIPNAEGVRDSYKALVGWECWPLDTPAPAAT